MTDKQNDSPKSRSGKSKIKKKHPVFLVIALSLVGALAVLVVLLLSNTGILSSLGISNKILNGITISGVDVSGMDQEEASDAISAASEKLLGSIEISIEIEGEITKYSAKDLGLVIESETAIEQALAYGKDGTPEEKKQAAETAETEGVDFALDIRAEKETLKAALLSLAEKMDRQPVDASFEFMPRGYLADGTKYEPNEQDLIKACANGKAIELPETIVRIAADQMPNKLRYEYYKDDKFINDYIPVQADISRFLYIEEVYGRTVDIDGLADNIIAMLQTGDYTAIVTAPVTAIEPAIKVEDLKFNTRLISSWTSSYASHYGYNRNWNLSKLSGIVNGVVIQPGEEWSINTLAGNRTEKTGWMNAPGIEYGGYKDSPGGGVCQISSTLYNAAIRSNLDITDSTHHSIISGYIPIGLDATISSGKPDLKIKNNQTTPIYIVSYTNPKDKNVTVEVYGQTVIDPEHGDVILSFTSKDLGSYGGTPVMNYIYNATVSYDGTPIEPGSSKVYAESRPGRKVQTYKHTYSLDGTELKVENFTNYQWKPINGTTYVNGPDPATLPPSPTPLPFPWLSPTPYFPQ